MECRKLLWVLATLEDVKFLKNFLNYYDAEDLYLLHLNTITRLFTTNLRCKHLYPMSVEEDSVVNVDKCFNVLAGRLTKIEATKAYLATKSIISKQGITDDYIFVIPSGRHIHQIAASDYALANGIDTLFINYGNFPGYIFLDPKGTDCLSSIYDDTTLIDRLSLDDQSVQDVFAEFTKFKRDQKNIPQATGSKWKERMKGLAFIIDSCFHRIIGFYGDRRVYNFDKAEESNELYYESLDGVGEFIFFPMQVSTDQQVLVNYEKGNIYSALDEAYRIAKNTGNTLVVREHPAEGRKNNVRAYLKALSDSHSDFKVSNLSVQELLDKCSKIITINSTVGLEARIKHKEVIFLGTSLYAKLDDEGLAKYLSRYLFPIDYHNPNFDPNLAKRFLKYSGAGK